MSAPAATKANPCVLRDHAKGYRFRFMGGPPRWEADGDRPSQETEIQISPDGNSLLEVIYNRAPPRLRHIPLRGARGSPWVSR